MIYEDSCDTKTEKVILICNNISQNYIFTVFLKNNCNLRDHKRNPTDPQLLNSLVCYIKYIAPNK